MKYFGAPVVLRRLLADLEDLESNGLLLSSGNLVKAAVVAGDNLGSLGIGGFTQIFSFRNFQ